MMFHFLQGFHRFVDILFFDGKFDGVHLFGIFEIERLESRYFLVSFRLGNLIA